MRFSETYSRNVLELFFFPFQAMYVVAQWTNISIYNMSVVLWILGPLGNVLELVSAFSKGESFLSRLTIFSFLISTVSPWLCNRFNSCLRWYWISLSVLVESGFTYTLFSPSIDWLIVLAFLYQTPFLSFGFESHDKKNFFCFCLEFDLDFFIRRGRLGGMRRLNSRIFLVAKDKGHFKRKFVRNNIKI